MTRTCFKSLRLAAFSAMALILGYTVQAAEDDKPRGMDRTIEFSRFENHADPKVLQTLLRQRQLIEARAATPSKARFWAANLCGGDADAFFVMTEFPSAMALAEARENPKAVEDMRQWEFAARNKGLALKFRSLLVSVGTPDSVAPPSSNPSAPPHTLQFAEFDPAGKTRELLEGFMRGAQFAKEKGGEDTGERGFWMFSGSGDHPMNIVTTAEFASRSAMLRMIAKVDRGPEFMKRVVEMQALGVKRVNECVMTEVLP